MPTMMPTMTPTMADALSLSTGGLYAVPLGLAIYQHRLEPLMGLLGLLITLGVGEGLKHGIIGRHSVRPQGARGCDAWCRAGPSAGQPGMPSTHTAFAAFFAAFYGPMVPWWGQMMFALYVIAVAWSRLTKRCHTMGQVVAGALLGVVVALLCRSRV